ncbi:hypothetical protein Vadar_011841 [Vaccinium darrowii]|uniref:Uncharacterized protein n=1 Tax=Vaccinium darrowii TaxID=229202 RepID=A0ACB7YD43_9ERIC|nr:hypothetical protein Vadar_011841 [Vaccinium darrowii]
MKSLFPIPSKEFIYHTSTVIRPSHWCCFKANRAISHRLISQSCARCYKATATTAALAKKYGPDVTVVVIDESRKNHWQRMISNSLAYAGIYLKAPASTAASDKKYGADITVVGGLQGFKLLERLGEGKKLTAIIREIADDISLDLVVMSLEAIHSKLVDANLLAEFIHWPLPRSTVATVEYRLRPVWLQFQMFF